FWLGFNLVAGIGPKRLRALLDYCGDIGHAWNASATTLRAVGLPQDAIDQLLYQRNRLDLDALLDRVTKAGVHLLTWADSSYPRRLLEIDDPPPLLYVRGDLLAEDEWAIAIVGTRSPSVYGKEVAHRLAGGLAAQGMTVISGLALGIDAIAHRAALDNGGRTLAVLGSGVDMVYPSRHRALADSIQTAGALLSEYPLGTKPVAGNFPPRNRIISGMSLGTLVVEAGVQSGALITLRYALEQGRETFAVPGSIHSRASAGTNRAIQRGEAKLVTCVEDILEELNLQIAVQQSQVRQAVPADATEEALLAHIGDEPLHIDELVRRSGLSTAAVSSTLCLMELKGLVRRVDNMSYVSAHD
ncbi:MAG: DNA-protecting protein DprA, partial [Chloroflexi bacterium]|nr:DNA-protecting protein DprA [Chloroflexota bacterium]